MADAPVVVALLAIPFGLLGLLLCHELGHAVPVLLSGREVHVVLGSRDGRTVAVGPFALTLGWDGPLHTFQYGYASWDEELSPRLRALALAAGPFVTLCAVVALVAVYFSRPGETVAFVAAYLAVSEAFRLYWTAWPRTYDGGPYDTLDSDGKGVLSALRAIRE